MIKKYFIHDNGSLPYMVTVDINKVTIYENIDEYYKLLFQKKVKKVYIGKDINNKKFTGNTILLQLTNIKFICITSKIFSFELEKDDMIVKYFSQIGNNDVPYPVLLGKKNFYSMVDTTFCNRDEFPPNYKTDDFMNGHTFYYGVFDKKKGWITFVKQKKLPKLKILYHKN